MKRDKLIFKLLDEEQQRQEEGIELIASENFVSRQVMEAAGSVATNKYAEGLPGKRYYGGCQVVDEIETIAIDRAKQLFNAEWANVQPHSGAQANAAVMLACLQPGDKIHLTVLRNGEEKNIAVTLKADAGSVNKTLVVPGRGRRKPNANPEPRDVHRLIPRFRVRSLLARSRP